MTKIDVAREALTKICDEIGFPAPQMERGIATWADECLDSVLVRGSPAWDEAHAHTIEALDAMLVENLSVARTELEAARDIAKREGALVCECDRPLHIEAQARHCLRCYRKRRAE